MLLNSIELSSVLQSKQSATKATESQSHIARESAELLPVVAFCAALAQHN